MLRMPTFSTKPQPPRVQPMRVATKSGDVFGAYTIGKLLGEGTYGFVFLAEQSTPVQRHVAIKILKREYPEATCSLVHTNAFELLVATILSAFSACFMRFATSSISCTNSPSNPF